MKKLYNFIIVILLIATTSGCSGMSKIKPLGNEGDFHQEDAKEEMSQKPVFFTQKKLTYIMAWNGIPVGRIIVTSGGIIKYRGRDVYVVTIKTESNEFLSKIYRVEDVYTSYVDTGTMTSMRFEADRREGFYRKHLIVEYDFVSREAMYMNLTDGSFKTCKIDENVQDPVSALCYFMTLPVKAGEKIHITVNLNEKNYKLYGEVNDVDVIMLSKLGRYSAFKVVPYAMLDGEAVKKGRGWIYFETDKRRYPLYSRLWIPFGKVTATLREVVDID